MLADKTCFILVAGKYSKYLQQTLSSSLFEFAYKRIFSSIELGSNGYQYNKHALVKLPIKLLSDKELEQFEKLPEEEQQNKILEFYGISKNEFNFSEN